MRWDEGNGRYCVEMISNGREWKEINCNEGVNAWKCYKIHKNERIWIQTKTEIIGTTSKMQENYVKLFETIGNEWKWIEITRRMKWMQVKLNGRTCIEIKAKTRKCKEME